MSSLVTPAYWELKEVALFLTQPNVLPPDVALSLYVSLGATQAFLQARQEASIPRVGPLRTTFPS